MEIYRPKNLVSAFEKLEIESGKDLLDSEFQWVQERTIHHLLAIKNIPLQAYWDALADELERCAQMLRAQPQPQKEREVASEEVSSFASKALPSRKNPISGKGSKLPQIRAH